MNTQTIHTNLYITHEDEDILSALADTLAGADIDKDRALTITNEFTPNGDPLVEELFRHQYVNDFNFEPDADEEHGYMVLHLKQDEWGDTSMVHFIDFLYELIPGIHAQAWGHTEDEPWEFFIKHEDGRAIKQEHTPWEDTQMDMDALEYIYKWWHEDMPDEIEAGLLSDDYEDEDEEDFEDDDFDDDN
ncbi:hypothetical protein [Kaarinaea lacus]